MITIKFSHSYTDRHARLGLQQVPHLKARVFIVFKAYQHKIFAKPFKIKKKITDNMWNINVVGTSGTAVPNCGVFSSQTNTLLGNSTSDGSLNVPLCDQEKVAASNPNFVCVGTEVTGQRSLRAVMRVRKTKSLVD